MQEKVVEIKGCRFGAGMPKICVPITGRTQEEILAAAEEIRDCKAQVVEWRADWYEKVTEIPAVLEVAKELRACFKEKLLLFTFRGKKEGGERELTFDAYARMNLAVADSKLVDLIDVEIFSAKEEKIRELVLNLHKREVAVIGSNHDFQKTPETEQMRSVLSKMQSVGVDLPKIAVMPKNTMDVVRLLEVTVWAKETLHQPVITMSMEAEGVISRLSGEVFGSAMTFGAWKKASAPGQMPLQELLQVQEAIHRSVGR